MSVLSQVQILPERIAAKAAWGRRVIGHLRERTEMIGDGAAPKEADGRHHDIVVGIVRRGRRRLGASVLVNPMIAIIEIGGTHFFSLLSVESSELGNSVVR